MKAAQLTQHRASAAAGPGISLFPFLAVLICTMGALVPLLMAITRTAQLQAETTATAKRSEQNAELKTQHEDVLWRIGQLKKSRRQYDEKLSDARLELGNLEDHARQLRTTLGQYERTLRDLDEAENAGQRQAAQSQAELERTQQRVVAARQQLTHAAQQAAGQKRSYAVVPYEGPNATRRRPIYLECREDSVVLQPEGILFVESDFDGPLGPGNPLAMSLRATREYLLSKRDFDPQIGEPYPLLLVRPEGIAAYYAARAAMKSWGFEFGYELVEDDWKLAYPPRDPRLAEILRQVVATARREQERLIAAAPRSYPGHHKVAYRAAPGGGIMRDSGSADDDAADSDYVRGRTAGSVGRNVGGAGREGRYGAAGGGSSGVAGDRDVRYGAGSGGGGTSSASTGSDRVAMAGAGYGSGGNGAGTGYGAGGNGVTGGSGYGYGGTGTGGYGVGDGSGNGTGNGSGNGVAGATDSGDGTGTGGGYGVGNDGGGTGTGSYGVGNGSGNGTGTGGVEGGVRGDGIAGGGETANALRTGGGAGTGGQAIGAAASGNPYRTSGGAGSSQQGSAYGGYSNNAGTNTSGVAVERPEDYVVGRPPREATTRPTPRESNETDESDEKPRRGYAPRPGEWQPSPERPAMRPDPKPNQAQDLDKERRRMRDRKSLAERRGEDWALRNAARSAVGVTRPIRVDCFPDRLVLISERGPQYNKTIPLGVRTSSSVDLLISAVWEHMDGWGIAGRGMYWRPLLQFHVASDAEPRYEDFAVLLQDSGIAVEKK